MKMRHFFFEKKNLNKNFLFLLDCKMSFLKFGIYTKKNEKKTTYRLNDRDLERFLSGLLEAFLRLMERDLLRDRDRDLTNKKCIY
jgi:hypothetical protein